MALELLIPVTLLLSLPQAAMETALCRPDDVSSEQCVSLVRPTGLTSRHGARTHVLTAFDIPGEALTVPTPINPSVGEFVRSFQERGRSLYARWHARMKRYENLMAPILARHGVPKELLYLCMVESGFDPDAVSRSSAVGLWQFIESTGQAYGLRRDDWVDERRDPIKSTDAAARHLKDLHGALGHWHLAFAAYNAGLGGVRSAMRRANNNDFWRIVALRELPREASRYVPKIIAAMLVGEYPDFFGMGGLPTQAPLVFEVVAAPGGLDLQRLSKGTGIPFKAITGLNPELLRGYTPPYGDDYALRVPSGQSARVNAWLNRQEDGRPTVFIEYAVRFGERLKDIARAHSISERTLRRANQMAGIEPQSGSRIIVPRKDQVSELNGLWVFPDPDLRFPVNHRKAVYFPVRWKMNARDIAAAFGVTPGQLGMWNDLDPTIPVQKGMVIRIFVPPDFDGSGVVLIAPEKLTIVPSGSKAASNALSHASARANTVKRHKHTIKSGESLWTISRKYGVTVAAIKAENGFGRARGIKPGKVIYVPRDQAPKAKGKAARRKAKSGIRGRRYRVKSGDSLWKISRKFGVPLLKLKKKNRLGRRHRLKPGQTLIIPR